MSNMSYCRFENTLGDFRDCVRNIDGNLSSDEHRARQSLVVEALRLLTEMGFDVTTIQDDDDRPVTPRDIETRLAEMVADPSDPED